MWHVTWMQGNHGNYWLLVVKSHTANLTPNPSFGHNLCFKCPNGSCKLILDIYVSRYFQWYKEFFNAMSFDPWNFLLKIWESIGTPTPKVGVQFGIWVFIAPHSPTFPGSWNVTPGLHFWPAPSEAFALVANPRLGLRQLLSVPL
jgi:hypothetical protein